MTFVTHSNLCGLVFLAVYTADVTAGYKQALTFEFNYMVLLPYCGIITRYVNTIHLRRKEKSLCLLKTKLHRLRI